MQLEVVGVFRKCRRCLLWRSLGNFNRVRSSERWHRARACNRCRKYFRKYEGYSGMYVLTDSGRAVLRALAAGDIQCEIETEAERANARPPTTGRVSPNGDS